MITMTQDMPTGLWMLGGGAESKQGFVGHVIGGMGAITQAMAKAFTSWRTPPLLAQ